LSDILQTVLKLFTSELHFTTHVSTEHVFAAFLVAPLSPVIICQSVEYNVTMVHHRDYFTTNIPPLKK